MIRKRHPTAGLAPFALPRRRPLVVQRAPTATAPATKSPSPAQPACCSPPPSRPGGGREGNPARRPAPLLLRPLALKIAQCRFRLQTTGDWRWRRAAGHQWWAAWGCLSPATRSLPQCPWLSDRALLTLGPRCISTARPAEPSWPLDSASFTPTTLLRFPRVLLLLRPCHLHPLSCIHLLQTSSRPRPRYSCVCARLLSSGPRRRPSSPPIAAEPPATSPGTAMVSAHIPPQARSSPAQNQQNQTQQNQRRRHQADPPLSQLSL